MTKDEALSLCDAKRVQLPVGEVYGWHGHGVGQPLCRFNVTEAEMPVGTQLYTSPPQRTWVGLTNNDLQPIAEEYRILFGSWVHDFARAIEAKLKEKNT